MYHGLQGLLFYVLWGLSFYFVGAWSPWGGIERERERETERERESGILVNVSPWRPSILSLLF